MLVPPPLELEPIMLPEPLPDGEGDPDIELELEREDDSLDSRPEDVLLRNNRCSIRIWIMIRSWNLTHSRSRTLLRTKRYRSRNSKRSRACRCGP